MVATEATVFVVDDDDAAREGLQELMESVGLDTRTYASAQAFLDDYSEEWSGCLLLDVRMPGISGLKLQEELNQRGSKLPILFLTGHGDIPMAVEALTKGAVDFLEKPAGGQVLLDKVHEAIRRNIRAQQVEARKRAVDAKLSLLSPKEKEVLDHIKRGERVKTLALEMGIRRKTVDWYLSMIREKMGVDSTSELLLLLHKADRL